MNVIEAENALGSLLVGGLFCAVGYIIINLGRRIKNADFNKSSIEKDDKKSASEQVSATSTSGSGTNITVTNSKRAKKKKRETQQEFNHPWMTGALKGHTAPVLDMNFSSNGKHLASCAEDCGPKPEEKLDLVKSSEMIKAPASSSSTKKHDERTSLSRRQRKNRTKTPREQRQERQERNDDQNDSPTDSPVLNRNRQKWIQRPAKNTTSSAKEHKKADNVLVETKKLNINENVISNGFSINYSPFSMNNFSLHCTSIQRVELSSFNDFSLECMLRRYILSLDELILGGYPMELVDQPKLVVFQSYLASANHRIRTNHHLNANAQEFYPSNTQSSRNVIESEVDSGNGSGSSVENSDLEQESSSESDKCSDISESCSLSSDYQTQYIVPGSNISNNVRVEQRKCARCFSYYQVDCKTGEYIKNEQCVFHWGKRRSGTWDCCPEKQQYYDGVWGCSTADMHVWTGVTAGRNGPFEDFVFTKPLPESSDDMSYGVYGIDCEMCFSKDGLALAQVTVVSLDGSVVYNELVRPEVEVIDYNTKFSGITAEDLANASKTLKDVQEDLLSFINSKTILIGHGLENDLRSLRIVHKTVADTSFAFPHEMGLPLRKSLKDLARILLKKNIQTDIHDPIEDARTAMDLMLRRLQLDMHILYWDRKNCKE